MNTKSYQKMIAIFCLLVMSGCVDSVRKTQQYLESAERYYDQENYAKARLEYRNALQIDNQQVDAYYYLALMDEKDKSWKSMYANLLQVIKLDSRHVDARLRLGNLHLLSGQLEQADQLIDEIFTLVTDNPKAFVLKAALLLRQKDTMAAMDMVDKALAIDPGQIAAISLKVVIYQAQNDFNAAMSSIDQALQLNPDDLSLNFLKLQLHIKQGDNAAIEKDYLALIQRFPEKIEFNFALVTHYWNQQEQAKSLQLIQSVINDFPDDVSAKLLLVDFWVKTDIDKAVPIMKQFISENKDTTAFYFRLADLYMQQKKWDQSTGVLQQIVDLKPDNKAGMDAKALLAKLDMQRGNMNDALALVNEILVVDELHLEAMILKARIGLVNALVDESIADLRLILREYPKSDDAMVLLAQAYLEKQLPELARENFRKALDVNAGNFSAVMAVVSQMIKRQDTERAEEVLQNALKVKPGHMGALQALAQVRQLNKDWLGMQKVAELIAAQPNGKGFSHYLTGKISQEQGFHEEAIKHYKLTLVTTPALADALKSMIMSAEALKQRDRMLVYLDAFIKNNPELAFAVVFKSGLYSLDKNWDQALSVLNEGLEKWHDQAQFYILKAEIYALQKNPEQRLETYKTGVENIPDNVQLRIFLANLYELQKDYDNAVVHYEAIISKQNNVDVAVNNLVSLLLDQYSGKENTARALALSQRFENSQQPYFLDTYGWALLQNNELGKALAIFEKVVMQKPDVAVFKYHLGWAYLQSGRQGEAISALQEALKLGAKAGLFIEQEATEQLLNEIKAHDLALLTS